MRVTAALVAELSGIPLARVGLGTEASEELAIGVAAAAVGEARAQLGLAPDPTGDRLRGTPYFTVLPAPSSIRS